LKLAWTRYWVSVSAGLALSLAGVAGAQNHPPDVTEKRRNEITLAGLRPGTDTVAKAVRLYRKPFEAGSENREITWRSSCAKETLTLELDEQQKVQTVRANEARWLPGDCNKYPPTAWHTGKGLRIGDGAQRVLELYGKPESRSPSTKGGQQLELLYYAFDWAGPDVPQVMEVVCTVGKEGEPGRVVEITLAASSL